MALLLAASGGDTVKLFDVSVESGDPCSLSYTPSAGCQVNSVKWNHTNLVVASAGDDKKVTLWRTNGQSMGTIPVAGSDFGDTVEESIFSINFSNKGSRYLCSGGSSNVVKIWDLQRKRCIKWLKGHTNTITGVIYNCKDEHLASISLSGDLIVHNLASGAKAAELKDPGRQVLRVLDYSRISRHLLVTAGDDGSVYLWDTTGRNPKVSWLKQHSAPASGISFSPSNDKIIASIGLDKKLYTFDSGTKRQTSCISYDAPFSSLAYRDDGYILAAGTSSGRVVFYDVRGKPQPITALRAYGNSEAVTSLSWQRSKPVLVNETCTAETALLGGAPEDSILMPDPLPSTTSSSFTQSPVMSGPRSSGRLISSVEPSFQASSSGGSITNTLYRTTSEETPLRNSRWTGGTLTRLHAPKSYNIKDDMEVFSPLVDVQPITPSLEKLWTKHDGSLREQTNEKKTSLFSSRRFPLSEDGLTNVDPVFDWKFSSEQDDTRFTQLASTPTASSRPEDSSSITPPEAWGGEKLPDKFAHHQQTGSMSRFSMLTSGAMTSSLSSVLQHSSSSPSLTSTSSLASSGMSFVNLRAKEISSGQEPSSGISGHIPFSALSLPLSTKFTLGQENFEPAGAASLTLPRRFSTYAERISANSSLGDCTVSLASPKIKKTGAETREELLNNFLSRSDISSAAEPGTHPTTNVSLIQQPRAPSQSDMQQGSPSFTLQLFQRTLEETLTSFQRSIHEDVRNLHIEVLRQFHMQEIETSSAMNQILDNQAELMKEVIALRKENQQLRQLL